MLSRRRFKVVFSNFYNKFSLLGFAITSMQSKEYIKVYNIEKFIKHIWVMTKGMQWP